MYNPALRECIKLFLNSLSGKLVEDPSRYFTVQYTPDSKTQMNGLGMERVKSAVRHNVWVNAGVMVYSYSKRLLFEYMKCLPANSDDVIHVETDSMYFDKRHNEAFRERVLSYKQPAGQDRYPVAIGSALGNVKVEKDTTDVSYFLGKKFYSIGELHKIKGIPLRTIDAHGNDIQLVSQELYEVVFQGGAVVVSRVR